MFQVRQATSWWFRSRRIRFPDRPVAMSWAWYVGGSRCVGRGGPSLLRAGVRSAAGSQPLLERVLTLTIMPLCDRGCSTEGLQFYMEPPGSLSVSFLISPSRMRRREGSVFGSSCEAMRSFQKESAGKVFVSGSGPLRRFPRLVRGRSGGWAGCRRRVWACRSRTLAKIMLSLLWDTYIYIYIYIYM